MMKTLKTILWEKKTWSLIENHLRKIVNRYLTIKCMTFRKMFCYKSNDYYAEIQGLKWTENLRSVQFKFTKKLNFSSVQVLFWKSELSSVQSSPKNELLNWTELFRSVRPIHWVLVGKYGFTFTKWSNCKVTYFWVSKNIKYISLWLRWRYYS